MSKIVRELSFEPCSPCGLLLRSFVGLDGLGLDDDRGVTFLEVLALIGDDPRDVTRDHREAHKNRCHDNKFSHNFFPFVLNSGAKIKQKNEATKKVVSRSVTMLRFCQIVTCVA